MTQVTAAVRRPRLRVFGSGPVATAFALFALRQGFGPEDIALEAPPADLPATLAARVLAMSLGSWQLLARIARRPPAAPIETVDVSIPGHLGRTRITAREMGVPAVGWVVRYGDLLGALREAACAAGLVPPLRGEAPHAAPGIAPADEVEVHAVGDAGDRADELRFDQAALLAEVEVASAQAAHAFECFTADGPLALLPLPEPRRYALVWCARPQDSRRRAELAPVALGEELQAAFGWSLGRLAFVTPPAVVPMVRRARRELVCGRAVWIGNAAQALHPVAGQGLNLGLRDAVELARCLGNAADRGRPVPMALHDYARARRLDRSGTIALTDTLARAFRFAPLRGVQSLALAALDVAPAARARLARQFMFGVR